jgi:hypothetical protein
VNLEDLRGLHVGDVVAWFGGDDLLVASFHHHANQAHWHTVNRLLRLSGSTVDGVASDAMGAVEWWRTIESLVALLYEIGVREGEAGVRPNQRALERGNTDVISRWSAVTRWFSEGKDSAPAEVTGRLTELRDFRNSFEHTSRTASRQRRHSRLSPSPAHANEVDLMEAMAICIAACEVVRQVVPQNDLMPQVVVPTEDSFFFEEIDVIAERLIVPIFRECVESRQLTSDFALYDKPPRLMGTALLPVALLVRFQDECPLPPLTRPVDAIARLRGYANSHHRRPRSGEFALPSYSLPADTVDP